MTILILRRVHSCPAGRYGECVCPLSRDSILRGASEILGVSEQAGGMSREDAIALVRRLADAVNAHDISALMGLEHLEKARMDQGLRTAAVYLRVYLELNYSAS